MDRRPRTPPEDQSATTSRALGLTGPGSGARSAQESTILVKERTQPQWHATLNHHHHSHSTQAWQAKVCQGVHTDPSFSWSLSELGGHMTLQQLNQMLHHPAVN